MSSAFNIPAGHSCRDPRYCPICTEALATPAVDAVQGEPLTHCPSCSSKNVWLSIFFPGLARCMNCDNEWPLATSVVVPGEPVDADRVREPVKVYLIATGETYSGYDTYTRHENSVPFSDHEVLYTAPIAPSAPAEAKDAVRAEPVALLTVASEDDPTWRGMNFIGLTEFGRSLPAGKYELHAAPTTLRQPEAADDLRKLKFVYRVLGNYAHAPVPDRADAYVMVRELIESTWNRGRAIEAPTFQQGYDKGISECAALGWKTPATADSSGAGRLAVPDYELAWAKDNAGADPVTALERFVLDNEPAGVADEQQFREGLAEALSEVTGRKWKAAAEGGQS